MEDMIYWTAKNNSTYLNNWRTAKTERSAVIAARNYLRGELMGEGKIQYAHEDENGEMQVFRTDEKSIFTKFKWRVVRF